MNPVTEAALCIAALAGLLALLVLADWLAGAVRRAPASPAHGAASAPRPPVPVPVQPSGTEPVPYDSGPLAFGREP